jgi:hypothetical protein
MDNRALLVIQDILLVEAAVEVILQPDLVMEE